MKSSEGEFEPCRTALEAMGGKRKLAEGELVLCMGVIGVREDFEFQTWLTQLGMRYLTGGSDLDYILSAGRAGVKRLREVQLP